MQLKEYYHAGLKIAAKRLNSLNDALNLLHEHTITKDLLDFERVYSLNLAHILRFQSKNPKFCALIVPPLINKDYILYGCKNSLINSLMQKSADVFLLSWSSNKQGDDIASYLSAIEAAIEFVATTYGCEIVLVGYCMGATLAMISAVKNKKHISSITTIAMPLDFGHFHHFKSNLLDALLKHTDVVHKEMWQLYFYIKSFQNNNNLYLKLSHNNLHSFSAIELWLADGIAMNKGFLLDFYNNIVDNNAFINNQIIISDAIYDFSNLSGTPITIILGTYDSVVPSDYVIPDVIKHAACFNVATGHLGLVMAKSDVVAEHIAISS